MGSGAGMTGFGSHTTRHLLLQRFAGGKWEPHRIVEARPLELAPLAHALHYGASIFEGFKAHLQPDGKLALFRVHDHLRRLNRSAGRMCLPIVDDTDALCRGIVELLRADSAEAPPPPGALYVRPLLFADEGKLGYATPTSALLVVMLGPVAALFRGPGVRLRTETTYVRAAPGGTGFAKCGGNYAGALLAQRDARAAGFDEVLWLDARERRFIEEAGGMNVMFVRGGALSTPPLTDTILPGVTRDSLLVLGRDAGLRVEERPISTDAVDWKDVSEAFCSGTAAGTAHIREIVHEGRVLFARAEPGPVAQELGERFERIKFGLEPDSHEWRLPV